jgi:DNA-directed RNA polymerase specialized sigma24 family protein
MLNREAALNVVHYAFKKLAEDIERVGEVNDYSGLVFQATWQSIKPHKSTQNEDISDISPVFAGLNRDERAVLFLSDVFGLPFEEVSKVLSLDHKALREILIKVRKVLTAASISF